MVGGAAGAAGGAGAKEGGEGGTGAKEGGEGGAGAENGGDGEAEAPGTAAAGPIEAKRNKRNKKIIKCMN